MKILVTGGAGFIGRRVVAKLIDRGHDVFVVDTLDEQVHGLPERAKHIRHQFDRMSAGDLQYHAEYGSFDTIVHLGAVVGVGQSMYKIREYVHKNTFDTAWMLQGILACRGQAGRKMPTRLVVASSMSIYGEGAYRSVDNKLILDARRSDQQLQSHQWEMGGECFASAPTPESKAADLTSIYALTKFDQEQQCLIFGRAYGVSAAALRFFNVYGPGQALSNPYTGAMAIFAGRLLNDQPPLVFEDGQQSRDFIHVEDVASAVALAAETPAMEGVFNVGTGQPKTILQVAYALSEALGKSIEPEIVGKYRAGDIRHCYADNRKIREFGWSPKVDWTQGIAAYAEWLREQEKPVSRVKEAAAELEQFALVR